MTQHHDLIWIDDLGLGHCPQAPADDFYGQAYWDEYVRRANSALGELITQVRCETVRKFLRDSEPVLDIGIGCGQFIERRGPQTFGFDVNPLGVDWLAARGRLRDPRHGFPNMTFWDALEHIPDASRVIAACERYVFVSMPIYRDEEHVRSSRHFKPGEHLWYFTEEGLVRWFFGLGFRLMASHREETSLGREDIGTYTFCRFR